jgi:hypothetical protein
MMNHLLTLRIQGQKARLSGNAWIDLQENTMISTLLIVFVVLAAISAARTLPYNIHWGEYDSNKGVMGVVIAVLIILSFTVGFIEV